MRPGRALAVIALVLLLVAIAFLLRSGRMQAQMAPKPSPTVRSGAPLQAQEFPPFTEVDPTRPPAKSNADPAEARRALAKALGALPLDRTNFWSQNLEAMHRGGSPQFREFARAFIAAAGEELVPIVTSLLSEVSSDEARFLLAAVLGEARRPEGVQVLRDLIQKEPGLQSTASALYSIGMIRTPEGLDYLKSYIAESKPKKEYGFLMSPALAAVGQHGADGFDFILAEARAREGTLPSKAQILGMVRGADAVDKLRAVFETDNDWSLRYGAALALGVEPSALDFLASQPDPGMVGYALLAARDIPDVWNATLARRVEIAERLTSNGVPSGNFQVDWKMVIAARLLPPDRARPLYESLAAALPEQKGQRGDYLQSFIAAFGDQPDLADRLSVLAEGGELTASDVQRAIEKGIGHGGWPGRNLGDTQFVRNLLEAAAAFDPNARRVKKGGVPMVPPSLTLSAVMRSGISESALSTSLEEAWRSAATPESKALLVESALRGAYPMTPMQENLYWTNPETFYARVIRDATDSRNRMSAVYAYIVAGQASTPDPAALRAISDMVVGQSWDLASSPTSWRLVAPVIGSYYARWGTAEDLPRLNALPQSFPMPSDWSPKQIEDLRSELRKETQRAIDAIRLMAN